MTYPRVILIVASLCDELKATVAALGLRWDGGCAEGEVNGGRAVAAVTGVGRVRAVARLDVVLEQHRPAVVLHVGFAGGLDPKLAAGEVLRFGQVINERGGVIDLDHGAGATLLTVDRMVDSVEGKRELFARYGAAAVDMESFAVAQRLREVGIPLIAMRGISDGAGFALPARAVEWVKADGSAALGPVLRYFAGHPHQLPMLLGLRRQARLAAENLAQAVSQVVRGYRP